MPYTREELDWMEAEWAFHLHGRSAFMRREDFLQLQAWAGAGVPADAIVNAMEPLRSDLGARALFAQWKRLQAGAPAPDAPGFLDHYDAERKAFKALVAMAEGRLGAAAGTLGADLAARLAEARLAEGTLVWRRAWDHHWGRLVCAHWGIPV